ncbi:MAG: MATE family efflux transporter, partial [Verrucomicrobiales bacterium]|nr:MATE family efflux transporter [Verrucomicrobiales bacterium]
GIASYTNTFVAQYFGAGKPERIGASVWQGIRLGIYVTPLFLILIPIAKKYFLSTTGDPLVADAEIRYFQILMFGCSSSIITAAQGAIFNGQGKTRIVMMVNIGAVLLNIFLDYGLILGNFGFPKLGIFGAGIATTASSWAMVLTFAILMRRKEYWEGCHLGTTWRHDSELMGRMIKFGTPNGLPMLVESITFHALVKIVLTFGMLKAAASSLVLSINQLAHFPLVGLGIACSILVGQRVASGRQEEAKTAIHSALIVGLGYSLFFVILYLILPDMVIKLHKEMMIQDSGFFSIREVAVILLRLAGLYLIIECIQLVFSGAIKGAGDTWFVLRMTVIVAVLTLVGYFAAKSMGLYAMWAVYILQIAFLGTVCIFRFNGGRWKNLSVIEKDKEEKADVVPSAE